MRAGFISKRFSLLLLIVVFLYLSMYTWNLRYGYLDRLSEITGMEITGWLLRPGNWVADEVGLRWRRYVHLVGVEQENEHLRAAVGRMALDMARLREDSARVQRLERYLDFNPPERWTRQGARVIAHRLGPTGALETFLVDKGGDDGIYDDAPVITPDGVVGRVMRFSPSTSTVLLLNDPSSHIPVLGRDSRTTGILVGQGPDHLLAVNYVPLNEPMNEGEILVSSGLARVFPKGIPVARVVSVERSDISLFKTVLAEPLVDVRNLEQILVLTRLPAPTAELVQAQAAPAEPQAGEAARPKAAQASKPAQSVQAQKPQPVQPKRAQASQSPAAQPSVAQERAISSRSASQPPARTSQTREVAPQAAKPQTTQGRAAQASPAPERTPQAQPPVPARPSSASEGVHGAPRTGLAAPATAAPAAAPADRPAAQDRIQPAPQPAGQAAQVDPERQASAGADKPRVAKVQPPVSAPAPVQASPTATSPVQPAPAQAARAPRQSTTPAGESSQPAWPPVLQSPSAPVQGQNSGGTEPAGQAPAQPPASQVQAPQPRTPEQSSSSPAPRAEPAE